LNGQIFDVLEPEDRPRDTYGDGRGLYGSLGLSTTK